MKALLLHAWQTSRAFRGAVIVVIAVIGYKMILSRPTATPTATSASNPVATLGISAFPNGPSLQASGPDIPGKGSNVDRIAGGVANGTEAMGEGAKLGVEVARVAADRLKGLITSPTPAVTPPTVKAP